MRRQVSYDVIPSNSALNTPFVRYIKIIMKGHHNIETHNASAHLYPRCIFSMLRSANACDVRQLSSAVKWKSSTVDNFHFMNFGNACFCQTLIQSLYIFSFNRAAKNKQTNNNTNKPTNNKNNIIIELQCIQLIFILKFYWRNYVS